ncbi:hypothetical protein BC833DRAFT_566532 [Globomyces pollinis-pini]|nr:hypothetical protein BC833DRAFT_566532 [Globomyces pollinis-pini]
MSADKYPSKIIKRIKNNEAAKKSRRRVKIHLERLECQNQSLKEAIYEIRIKIAVLDEKLRISDSQIVEAKSRHDILESRCIHFENLLKDKIVDHPSGQNLK